MVKVSREFTSNGMVDTIAGDCSLNGIHVEENKCVPYGPGNNSACVTTKRTHGHSPDDATIGHCVTSCLPAKIPLASLEGP